LESLPCLLGSGFVLPRDRLFLGEYLAFPHSRASRHRHFVDAGQYAAIGEGGAKLIKGGEVGRGARGGVLLLPVPFCLVFELL
jgi:hypothetical protein